MSNNDLRKMGKSELLEMLIKQTNEVKRLNELLEQKTKEPETPKYISADNPGTMAEAALAINGVFTKADQAAKQYVDSIIYQAENSQRDYEEIIEQANQKASEIIAKANEIYENKLKEAENFNPTEKYNAILLDAKNKAQLIINKANAYSKQKEEEASKINEKYVSILNQAKTKAEEILKKAEEVYNKNSAESLEMSKQSTALINQSKEKAQAIIRQAEEVYRKKITDINNYVANVNNMINKFYDAHPELPKASLLKKQ